MLNRQGLIPLREHQRFIATYDAGETPCSPEQAERQIRSLVQCFEGSHVGILQRCLGVIRAFQKSNVLEMWESRLGSRRVWIPWLYLLTSVTAVVFKLGAVAV